MLPLVFYHPPIGQRTLASWWFMLRFGAIVLVLLLTPSTHNRTYRTYRATTAQCLCTSTWQVLPWFTALSALLSLVLIRIVVVTALSYGLSQYALQMVVRVLVLELIPLSAALFVALRAGLAVNAEATSDCIYPVGDISLTRLHTELLPRVLADAFSVLALATLSSVMALVLAYLVVYGLSPWGLPGFTRTVGQVFDLTVSLGLMLKVSLFSLAVAMVPMAAKIENHTRTHSTMQPGAVRLFVVLLMLEAASLTVNYI
jgi:phospholipid/cholesterol/gamma-HCH transport system permease protein